MKPRQHNCANSSKQGLKDRKSHLFMYLMITCMNNHEDSFRLLGKRSFFFYGL